MFWCDCMLKSLRKYLLVLSCLEEPFGYFLAWLFRKRALDYLYQVCICLIVSSESLGIFVFGWFRDSAPTDSCAFHRVL